jgi:hypothetical protein
MIRLASVFGGYLHILRDTLWGGRQPELFFFNGLDVLPIKLDPGYEIMEERSASVPGWLSDPIILIIERNIPITFFTSTPSSK